MQQSQSKWLGTTFSGSHPTEGDSDSGSLETGKLASSGAKEQKMQSRDMG